MLEVGDWKLENPQVKIENQQSKIKNPACPFCKSNDTEMIALFGQQMMTSQYFCNQCRTGFEAVKWDANLKSLITIYQ